MNNFTPEIPKTGIDSIVPEMRKPVLEALKQQHLNQITSKLNHLNGLIDAKRKAIEEIGTNVPQTTIRLDYVDYYLGEATHYGFNKGNVPLANAYIEYVNGMIKKYLPEEPLPEAAR